MGSICVCVVRAEWSLKTSSPASFPRLREAYQKTVLPAMMKEFSYRNPMQVPRLDRIVVNVGMGEASQNIKLLDGAVTELGLITGQKAMMTRARNSISEFKLRRGQPVGCKVTLRGSRMFEFLDRLISVALPRITDFRGISPHAFDGRGNFTLGIREQLIFPEISYDSVVSIHGMDIVMVTTAKNNDEGRVLLRLLGMPFRTS